MSKQQGTITSLWNQDSDSDDALIILDDIPPPCTAVQRKTSKPDVSIVKAASAKNASQWVSSAFDGFGGLKDDFSCTRTLSQNKQLGQKSKSVPVKRRQHCSSSLTNDVWETRKTTVVSRRQNKLPETQLWAEKYIPRVQGDLAVHKKKIQEVESWLREHLSGDRKVPPILLLTGPAGVGKTATVKVLAQELQSYLHEWTNPVSDTFQPEVSAEEFRNRSVLERISTGSQLSQFHDFLLRANKYNTLDMTGGGVSTRKVILVEEFPNVFYRDQTPFHDILRKYLKVGGSPLVFVISDSSKGESNERLLFPKALQQQLHIENISFNPIAQTSMIKILTKIATQESSQGSYKFTVPSKCVIESIAMASAGDIRGAINALQFACLKDTCDLNLSNMAKRKPALTKRKSSNDRKVPRLTKTTSSSTSKSDTSSSHTDDELAAIGGRDTSLFLFRALGKILYCKRDEPDVETDLIKLPTHLSHHYRDPLQFKPEDVVEKSHLSGDFFSAYLHQNYLEFFSSIEDVVNASEYLSDADYLTTDWASRSALQHYAASVAARGIIFCNTARARHKREGGGLGWKPLHKPQWYSVGKQARQNCESARFLFRSYRSPPEVLQTDILPYISLINSTLNDTGQIALIQEICRFSSHRGIGGGSEMLDEKDVAIDDDVEPSAGTSYNQSAASKTKTSTMETDDVISTSQSNLKNSAAVEEEEEYEIEDFDDDF